VPATTTDRSDERHAEAAESVESHIGSPTPSLVVLHPGAPQRHSQTLLRRSDQEPCPFLRVSPKALAFAAGPGSQHDQASEGGGCGADSPGDRCSGWWAGEGGDGDERMATWILGTCLAFRGVAAHWPDRRRRCEHSTCRPDNHRNQPRPCRPAGQRPTPARGSSQHSFLKPAGASGT
jgi:hypothetical protein